MYTPKFIARLPIFYMNLKRIFSNLTCFSLECLNNSGYTP